ncbi:hypothetical protein K402DRAFT_388552 [Aulographum hederae CBS 113979]|uniref:Uncharacterized protein n=1 Tax=Aulographum hederae CBS 113979 TaxID=1176131 RepID=A0A6G1HFH5_9PEZI|nr:hypothetical protein K402DRAFT_388552 [Aulographum hederae CBS 113979]
MSGGGDKAWRRQSSQNQRQAPAGARDRPNSSTPKVANRQSVSGAPGNVWANQNKGKGSEAQRGQSPQATGFVEEKHVPVNGFNADEVKEWMKNKIEEDLRGLDENHYQHKMPSDYAPPKSAWGARPNIMANGQDFWVTFRKALLKAKEERDAENSQNTQK